MLAWRCGCRSKFRSVYSVHRHSFESSSMKRAASGRVEGQGKTKQTKLFEQEKKTFDVSWKYHGDAVRGVKPLMYLTGPAVSGSTKVASFDMDGCLIETNSGKKFPTGPSDWKFLSGKVPTKLKALHADGYKIVIFTNQAGIEKKKTKDTDIQLKIKDIISSLGFPCQALVSTGENIYRKPYSGSWDYFVEHLNEKVEVNMSESFFVGDAAGRPKDWAPGKKKDHSCSDRKFAANVGLKFYTPEEYFDNAKSYNRFVWGSVNPKTLIANASNNKATVKSTDHKFDNIPSKDTEMIIMVGYPASGKSTFAKRFLVPHGYAIINRDTLKTQEKCVKEATEKLKTKNSVVIDNTNPSRDARKVYIDIAKKAGVAVRCLHFDTPKDVAQHMNYFRQARTLGAVRRIPDVGYNMFTSRFQVPEKSEGFTEVRKIPFTPVFDSDVDKELFLKWT